MFCSGSGHILELGKHGEFSELTFFFNCLQIFILAYKINLLIFKNFTKHFKKDQDRSYLLLNYFYIAPMCAHAQRYPKAIIDFVNCVFWKDLGKDYY